ncbi:hypothetical protein [Asticcacaulis sp. 201]|uniref:hypothetical protein n=1 Tax=Asticcacaulis sp. 201 TaxID=3028787 RepID=UPI002916E58C|nr:hypothetical protein [Asticcacaulis sp. 201]MDV6331162.1 hypothetical protein [Asticcacaulis sp. 201]
MSEIRSVFIATPCFGGLVTQGFMQSVLALMQYVGPHNIQLTLALLGNDALITRSRNSLVSSFLNATECSHLLFIDADITFEPEQLIRMLKANKDVVGGIYPLKTLDWERVARAETTEAPEEQALHYVGNPADNAKWDGDFATADYAGTGFLLIRREVIVSMIAAYPTLRYSHIHAYPRVKSTPDSQYALFECMIDPESGLYLSEDFAFCQRWRDIGGEIWLDTVGKLTHVGSHNFVGNPSARFVPPLR